MAELAQSFVDAPLSPWVLGSVLAYVLGFNALWLLRPKESASAPVRRWLEEGVRFAFYLGIPYLVLGGWPRPPFSGLLSLQDLGLVGAGPQWPATRWVEAVGTGLGLGLVALLLLLLGWAGARRVSDGNGLRFPHQSWWALLVEGAYLEVHWAFYRAAIAVVLGDVYTGVFVGLGLVYLEWGLNPFWRAGWRTTTRAAEQWLRVALALVAGLIFLLTRNLWVCMAAHWLLAWTFWRLGRERAA